MDSIYFSWGAEGGAYGGHGYCLYADGMSAPGMAASISADVKICSGQLMYCSAWLRNPRKSGGNSNPIFRFNVQGSNDMQKWDELQRMEFVIWYQVLLVVQLEQTMVKIFQQWLLPTSGNTIGGICRIVFLRAAQNIH